MNLLQIVFTNTGKVQFTPTETAKLINRSTAMLAKDRMAGLGPEYKKIGKGKNAKVYYTIEAIVAYLEKDTIKTA